MQSEDFSLEKKEVQVAISQVFIHPSEFRSYEQNLFVVKVLQQGRYMEKIKDQQSYLEWVKQITLEKYNKGEDVIKEGEIGNSCFIIVSGNVEGWRKITENKHKSIINNKLTQIFILGAGHIFGQSALVYNQPRNCTVRALTEVECLKITKDIYCQYEASARSQHIREIEIFLEDNFLFSNLSKESRKRIAEKGFTKKYLPNRTIIEQGSFNTFIYFIKLGIIKQERIIYKSKLDEAFKTKYSNQLKKLPEKIVMDIGNITKGGQFGEYEFLNLQDNLKICCTYKTYLPSKLILISYNDLKFELKTDEINILLKNSIEPFDDKNILEIYFDNVFWVSFKKQLVNNIYLENKFKKKRKETKDVKKYKNNKDLYKKIENKKNLPYITESLFIPKLIKKN